MAGTDILDVDALIPERPKVKLPKPAGNRRSFLRRNKESSGLYELTIPSDLGILELKAVERLSNRIGGFQGRENELSDEQLEVLTEAMDELTGMLIRNCPANVLAGLDDWQKLAIIRNFHGMFPDTDSEGSTPLSTTGS